MKKFIVMAAAVAVVFSSCGIGGKSIKTDLDSVAYAIGVDLGTQLKASDSLMNPNLVAKGIIDVFKGRAKMTQDSARMIQQEYFTVKLPAKKQKAEEEYLVSVPADNKNAVKLESGLIYEVLNPGDETVKATSDQDTVKVTYVGRFRDGKEFDSSKQDTVSFPLNRVIRGWTEGMKLVGKGGKLKLWVPSELAYGPQGNQQWGGPIGPYEPLVFEVEVIDIIPAAAPVEVPAVPAEKR